MILDWKKYEEKAAEAVAEGIVMLENRNRVLPVDKDQKIAVFGRIQLDYYKSGTGSGGMVNVSHVINIPEGLKLRGAKLDEELLGIYEKWTGEHPFDRGASWGGEPWSQEEMPLDDDTVQVAASRCGYAICVIGRTAGEDKDNSRTEGSWLLTKSEMSMLRKVRDHFEKMIVCLNTGSIIDMSFVDTISPDAVLYVWQGGMMGGLGTADVILGNVSPSGKLTDTIAYSVEDYPSDAHFGDGDKDFYCEDIYVGYRYFETFAKDKVRYPFGYGLSYTDFEFENVRLDATISANDGHSEGKKAGNTDNSPAMHTLSDIAEIRDRKLMITVKVTNKGLFAGKEVVQVYCEAPQGKLGKPARVLCGFKKTRLLKPKESEDITVTISPEDIASYDDSGVTGFRYSYVLEKGLYTFYVANNVRDAGTPGTFRVTKVTGISGTSKIPEISEVSEVPEISAVSVTLADTTVIRHVESALAPVEPFERMINKNGRPGSEPVPLSAIDEKARRNAAIPQEIEYTGDINIRLEDVAAGRNSMNEFIAQLADEDLACIVRGEGMGSPRVTAGTAAAFGGVSKRLEEYGIPCACCSDGPSGIRLDCGTKAFALPGGALLACSWNTGLQEELFTFTGYEMSANKVECLLGPGMNIRRHPLNGRNFEYFSEDPFLTGQIAAAQLHGLAKGGTTGTVKHFCANNRETKRHSMDSVISERALREIYLRGFEKAVKEGGAVTIMTTYGSVNGLWTAGSFDLNTTILRGEWGFKGLVMTDWWATINRRGCEQDRTDLAAMVIAQNDVYMVCADSENHEDNILKALSEGDLKKAELQRSAANILNVLIGSNAMKRALGTCEQVTIEGRDEEGKESQEKVPCYVLDGELDLDLSGVKTDRDTSYSFILDVRRRAAYKFTLTASSDAGKLAQIPVTVFSMGTASGTFTWNGTGGKPVSFSGRTFMFSRYTTIRLYFALGGLNLIGMRFEIDGE